MMKKAFVLSVLLGATFAATVQPALADAEGAITARRSYYQVVKFNAGPLFGMAKGNVAYDAEKAQMFANNLKALASMKNGAMWAKGTDNVAMKGKTRALPAIWAADSKVAEKGAAWRIAIDELVKVAGKGLDGLKPAVGELGKSCGGCHKPYRADDF
jgi:cytochrome c556